MARSRRILCSEYLPTSRPQPVGVVSEDIPIWSLCSDTVNIPQRPVSPLCARRVGGPVIGMSL